MSALNLLNKTVEAERRDSNVVWNSIVRSLRQREDVYQWLDYKYELKDDVLIVKGRANVRIDRKDFQTRWMSKDSIFQGPLLGLIELVEFDKSIYQGAGTVDEMVKEIMEFPFSSLFCFIMCLGGSMVRLDGYIVTAKSLNGTQWLEVTKDELPMNWFKVTEQSYGSEEIESMYRICTALKPMLSGRDIGARMNRAGLLEKAKMLFDNHHDWIYSRDDIDCITVNVGVMSLQINKLTCEDVFYFTVKSGSVEDLPVIVGGMCIQQDDKGFCVCCNKGNINIFDCALKAFLED